MREASAAGKQGERPASVIRAAGLSKNYRRQAGRKLRTLKSAFVRRTSSSGAEEWIPALTDVSFEVAPGELFSVIGGNGSGKSTLLKLVAGILRPTAGTLAVDGRVTALIELGAGFHPDISGREKVFIAGQVLGLSRKEIAARYERIVDFSGLGDFLEEPVKNYSSGMYVRLGFAVAVHTDPEVLLVDEVLAVGDEAFQRKFERDKAELRELGVPLETGSASVFDTEPGYRIARPQYELPDVLLAPDEAAAVGIAAGGWIGVRDDRTTGAPAPPEVEPLPAPPP